MPATVITDGDFTVASAISVPVFSAPFDGDNGRYLLEQEFEIDPAFFSPLALNIPHPSYPLYYLVEESPLQAKGGGMVTWKRSYMAIPNARSDYESFAYRLPGIAPGGSNTPYFITASSTAGTTTTLATSAAHGLSPGDNIMIVYKAVAVGLFEVNEILNRTCIGPTSGTTVSVFQIVLGGNANYQPNYLQKSGLGRNPITRVLNSRIDWAFYMPTVSVGISTVNDIPIQNPVIIQDLYQNQVEIYGAQTTPSSATYYTQVAANTWIVAEASNLKRIKGNLYGRATRYVVAQ